MCSKTLELKALGDLEGLAKAFLSLRSTHAIHFIRSGSDELS